MAVKSKPKTAAPAPVNHPLSFPAPAFGTLDAAAAETLRDHAADVAKYAADEAELKADYVYLLSEGCSAVVDRVRNDADKLETRRNSLNERFADLRRRRFSIAREVIGAFKETEQDLRRALEGAASTAKAKLHKEFQSVSDDVLEYHVTRDLATANLRAQLAKVHQQVEGVEELALVETPNVTVRNVVAWPAPVGEDQTVIARLIGVEPLAPTGNVETPMKGGFPVERPAAVGGREPVSWGPAATFFSEAK